MKPKKIFALRYVDEQGVEHWSWFPRLTAARRAATKLSVPFEIEVAAL